MEEKFTFKIIIIGDSNVGKSTFFNTFINEEKDVKNTINIQATVGVDFHTKVFQKENKFIKLLLWDTSGQEKFKSLTSGYFRNVDCIIFMYDIKNNMTRNHIRDWMTLADQHIIDPTSYESIIVANKYDLLNDNERESILNECKEFSNSFKKDFFVCSSLHKIKNFEVMFIFIKIIDKLLENYKSRPVKKTTSNNFIMLSEKSTKNNSEYQCIC